MIERDNDDTMMVEIVLPRIEDEPAMPEDFDMDERECAECGSMVYYEPHPEVGESNIVVVCSQCRPMALVGVEEETCSGDCDCDCFGETIEGLIALPGHETDSEIRTMLN